MNIKKMDFGDGMKDYEVKVTLMDWGNFALRVFTGVCYLVAWFALSKRNLIPYWITPFIFMSQLQTITNNRPGKHYYEVNKK